MKPLNIDELTVEQKIGQLLVVRGYVDDEDREYVLEMIRKRCVGGIQVPPKLTDYKTVIKEVKENADYPILIITDAENGFPTGEYNIPSAMALSITGDEELAYQFGASTAIEAKKHGYNTIWGTIADLKDGNQFIMLPRSLGSDPEHVARMTTAILRGFADNGIVGGLKHWPAAPDVVRDSHVYDDRSQLTEKDIMDSIIIPYRRAMEQGVLNSVMSDHAYYPKIDDTYPATLSEKLTKILRDAGYDGVLFTDSFGMLGVLQNFGEENCYGLAVKAGQDMILPNYRVSYKTSYEYMMNAYKNGVFTEERLNEAVRRIIAAQNATFKPATADELSDYQKECYTTIAKESICLIKDEDVAPGLDKSTKKLFVVLKENLYKDDDGLEYEIVYSGGIDEKNIGTIKNMITEKFPGSSIVTASIYPNPREIEAVCKAAINVDEVIFLTFALSTAYGLGGDFAPRTVHLMEAVEKKISTIIHLGNPFPLEVVPHFKRVLISIGGSDQSIEHSLSVLNGEYVPKGKLPFTLQLK